MLIQKQQGSQTLRGYESAVQWRPESTGHVDSPGEGRVICAVKCVCSINKQNYTLTYEWGNCVMLIDKEKYR